jgi:hypothetical protein
MCAGVEQIATTEDTGLKELDLRVHGVLCGGEL